MAQTAKYAAELETEARFWHGLSLAKERKETKNHRSQVEYYLKKIERDIPIVVMTTTGNNFVKRLSELPVISRNVARDVYGYSRL